jgi:glutamate synthase domain-containing protein 3
MSGGIAYIFDENNSKMVCNMEMVALEELEDDDLKTKTFN